MLKKQSNMLRSITFFLLLCTTACLPPTQEIDLEFPYDAGMTLYGFWSLDRPYELFVGNSLRTAEAGELTYLPNAEVLLYGNGEQVDSLRFDKGRYVSTTASVLLPEVEYEVRVTHPDFPPASATLTFPSPTVPSTQLVNTVSQNEEEITFTAESWLLTEDYLLGFYPYDTEDSIITLAEPLDSLFIGFGLRNPFQRGGDLSTEFTLGKTIELVPPLVPEFTVVELSALEFVAYRLNDITRAYQEYTNTIRGPLPGSNELPLVDLTSPGNVEGGYGLVTYYEEVRQKVSF
ncbi:hypothetical protein CEQ90_07840 [Lewinellaceae bacterium SD302]|nr:hypothetical protein CEQ90_07840 [Lewinellaceae bacterium SD302]